MTPLTQPRSRRVVSLEWYLADFMGAVGLRRRWCPTTPADRLPPRQLHPQCSAFAAGQGCHRLILRFRVTEPVTPNSIRVWNVAAGDAIQSSWYTAVPAYTLGCGSLEVTLGSFKGRSRGKGRGSDCGSRLALLTQTVSTLGSRAASNT